MNKSFITTSTMYISCLMGLNAQNVTIPDANFKAYLVANTSINTNGDANISVAEAAAYSGKLNVSSRSIADLTGIAAFTSISELDCTQNSLTSLNIASNTALTILKCPNNQLASLNVSANTLLTVLDCGNNTGITSINISANTALTSFSCYNNYQISTLNLSSNTLLKTLMCDGVHLTSLSLTANTALETLSCNDCQLSALNVSANTLLTSIKCNSNTITSLDVSASTGLTELYCDYNGLTSLNVSGVSTLKTLSCSGNNLSTLDISTCTALTDFDCQQNHITALNLSGAPNLQTIYCNNNIISSLDFTACSIVQYIDCHTNSLNTLTFNANSYPKLYWLDCYNNYITNLDLSKCGYMQTVNSDNNMLTGLNLTHNVSLVDFSCTNNQLTYLYLRNGNNTSLSIWATSNPNLTCILVDDATWAASHFTNVDPGVSFSTTCGITPPVFTGELKPSDICSRTAFFYTPTSSSPNTNFKWTTSDLPGILSASLQIKGVGNISDTLTNLTISPIDVTYHYVTILNDNGVSDAGVDVVVRVNPCSTGVEKIVSDNQLNISPNPFLNIFNMDGVEQNSMFEIENSIGVIILKDIAQSKSIKIDLTEYPGGIYYLKVTNTNSSSSYKLLKL